MKIRIHDGSVPIDEVLRAHVERRMAYALSAFAGRVKGVVVRMSREEPRDAKRPDRCEIEVSLHPRSVKVADTGADSFAAVENASVRLMRSIARALAREQAWKDGEPVAFKSPPAK